jgi:hypothetical protein
MAKINLDLLLSQVKVARDKLGRTSQLLADHGLADTDKLVKGKISQGDADWIQAEIAGVVKGFQENDKFNFRAHVTKPLFTLIKIIDTFDVSPEDRPQAEEVITEVIKGTYKQHKPKIPYLPGFIANWLENKLLDMAVPAIVDEFFDLVQGEDDASK